MRFFGGFLEVFRGNHLEISAGDPPPFKRVVITKDRTESHATNLAVRAAISIMKG